MRIIGIIPIHDFIRDDRILSVPAGYSFRYHVHTEDWIGGIWSFEGLHRAIGEFDEIYETF
jgi:hypothetical protein